VDAKKKLLKVVCGKISPAESESIQYLKIDRKAYEYGRTLSRKLKNEGRFKTLYCLYGCEGARKEGVCYVDWWMRCVDGLPEPRKECSQPWDVAQLGVMGGSP